MMTVMRFVHTRVDETLAKQLRHFVFTTSPWIIISSYDHVVELTLSDQSRDFCNVFVASVTGSRDDTEASFRDRGDW